MLSFPLSLQVKLSREYHILKGVQYKQGTISSMLIDLAAKSSTWENIADDKSISTKPPDGGDVVEDQKKKVESHATTSRQTPQQSADPAISSTATGCFGDSHSDVDAVKARAQSEPTAVFKKGFLTAASQSVSKTAAGGKIVEMPAASPSLNPSSTPNKQQAVRGIIDFSYREHLSQWWYKVLFLPVEEFSTFYKFYGFILLFPSHCDRVVHRCSEGNSLCSCDGLGWQG